MAAAAAVDKKKRDDEKAEIYIHTTTWRNGVGRGLEWYKVDLEQNHICRVFERLSWPAAFFKYYTAVALDSVIYLLGVVASPLQLSRLMCMNTFDAVVYTDTKFGDVDDAQWQFAPHMKCSRRPPRVAALHGKIYAFGGAKRGDHFAEVFDPKKGCWDFLPGPPTDHLSTRVLSDSSKGRILVYFACEISENSLYAYDLADESWKCLNPHFGDWYEQCALVDDMLYCLTRDHRFLIAYDLVSNEWLTAVWSDSNFSIPKKWDVLLHLGSNKFCVAIYSPVPSIPNKVEMGVYFFQFLINKDLAGNLLITPDTCHSFTIEGGTVVDNYLLL